MSSKPRQCDDASVHDEVHDGVVQSHEAFRLDVETVQGFGCLCELAVLVLFAYEGLDHPNGSNVLLNTTVEIVVLDIDLLEQSCYA